MTIKNNFEISLDKFINFALYDKKKVYYMQKGANGKFITDATGFLDQAASDAKKLLVTEVYSDTVAVN